MNPGKTGFRVEPGMTVFSSLWLSGGGGGSHRPAEDRTDSLAEAATKSLGMITKAITTTSTTTMVRVVCFQNGADSQPNGAWSGFTV